VKTQIDSTVYRFGELTLDHGKRRVYGACGEIHMGPLSYKMLHVLVQLAPNVVSYDELADRVWAGRPVTPETLAQRVKLMRYALCDDPRQPRYINLVRAQGYSLIPEVEVVGDHTDCRRALAVLPFENLSEDSQDRYFAVGVHEEILTHLARLASVLVLARANVRDYEHTRMPIQQIADELGVGAVMEGSIRYAREKVRITAQLIDGTTGAHLWAESFEHERDNDFEVQNDVAMRIALAIDRLQAVGVAAGERPD